MLLIVGLAMARLSAAPCVVGSTDFDVSSTLCDINLTNDEKGWFSSNLNDKIEALSGSGCTFYASPSDAIQTGIASYGLTVPGKMITFEAWQADSVSGDVAKNKVGYSSIVSNPKLISPILGKGSGSPMLVNFGTSAENSYVFAYTAKGLTPGATVTFSVDVYNLLDYTSLATFVATKGLTEGEINIFGAKYDVQQKKWNGEDGDGLLYKISTNLNGNGALEGGETAEIQPGQLTTFSYSGVADENGNITFYVGRTEGMSNVPLGFDNVRVESELKPEISYSGYPCPSMPILVGLKNTYPEGTTYQWRESVTGATGTGSTFSFEAPNAGTYKIQVAVAIAGCDPSSSDVYELTVNDCCKDAEGNPMAMVDVFFDDFGSFEGNQYTYTDLNGEQQTVDAKDLLNGSFGYCVSDLKNNGAAVKVKYNKDIKNEGYAIGTKDPYSKKLISHDEDAEGGFLMIDIKSDGWKGKSLYEQTVCGLCPGKEVTFGAAVSAINSNTKTSVGTLSVELIDESGEELYSSGDKKLTGPAWEWYGETFTLPAGTEGCATMRIVSKEDDYEDGKRGDFAIDDITFRVCLPPDINIGYELEGSQDLTDLCTDDLLTLVCETSSASSKFFGETMSYMFQYTYDDPRVTDAEKVNWISLTDDAGVSILTTPKFQIKNPADHPSFAKIKSGEAEEVYFRVVVGKSETLKDPEELKVNALSPCRNISVCIKCLEAGLNCDRCTAPDANVFAVEGGYFDPVKNVIELSKEVGITTISLKNPIHGVKESGDDYYDYTVSWYKGSSVETGTAIAGASTVMTTTKNTAPPLTVNYEDVTEEGIEYTVFIHDNFDAAPTACDVEYTLTVKSSEALSPIVQDVAYCEGEPLANLTAEKQPKGTKTAEQYTLLWYGTNKPANTLVAAELEGDTYPLSGNAEVLANGVTTTSYWVAQRDEQTKAVSSPVEIKVTVYPTPVLSITDPEEVCSELVDLKPTSSITNEVPEMTYTTTFYSDENGSKSLGSTSVAESGTYYVQSSYNAKVASGEMCMSEIQPIQVVIDTLDIVAENVETCPDRTATLEVKTQSNVSSITYNWSGDGDTGNTAVFETRKFTEGNYGDIYKYKLTVTAGKCVKEKALTVTLGSGPVVGTLTLSDPTNQEIPTKIYKNDLTTDVYYYCGENVIVTPNYEGESDYELTGPTDMGSNVSPFNIGQEGEYTLSFTNGCPTKVSFSIRNAEVSATSNASELDICEKEEFHAELAIQPTNSIPYTIMWKKDGVVIPMQTGVALNIGSVKVADSGSYEAMVNRRGCVSIISVGTLNVKSAPNIALTLPETPIVCAGETIDLSVSNVLPEGTTIVWNDDATIQSGLQGESITVMPKYKTGSGHQSTSTYSLTASNETCNATKQYQVTVKVDEPLKGEITGTAPVCEGGSVHVSASTYGADAYVWTIDGVSVGENADIVVTPSATTTYEVKMTRGTCAATDHYEAVVVPIPEILSMDSVGIRDRVVQVKSGTGYGTMLYWLDDDKDAQTSDILFEEIAYGTHKITVEDGNGCTSSLNFKIVPPSIYIPDFFTPNGDGVNDIWVVTPLAEAYPEAVVNIYDRWGKLLASYLGAEIEGWDGIYGGRAMPSSDYWYVINVGVLDEQYTGHFTLIRR